MQCNRRLAATCAAQDQQRLLGRPRYCRKLPRVEQRGHARSVLLDAARKILRAYGAARAASTDGVARASLGVPSSVGKREHELVGHQLSQLAAFDHQDTACFEDPFGDASWKFFFVLVALAIAVENARDGRDTPI